MADPYKSAPDRAFWSRAVARNWNAAASVRTSRQLISPGEKVASAGSCFAVNIIPYLEKAGLTYVRAEQAYEGFSDIHVEGLSYDKFSAAYGNIYTPRHLLQLLQRALGQFQPVEDRWPDAETGTIIDPFRPGLIFRARNDREFDALTRQHLDCVIETVRQADVFIFTLGLTEAWISVADGAVYPACPGTVAGAFDPERHAFKNFTAAEVTADMTAAIALMRTINPSLRLILTVSPVPLVATATEDHVLVATIYSKSVLRVAAGEVAAALPDVTYFPAYEIVTGPQAPQEHFAPNRRDVTSSAIEEVVDALLAACQARPGDTGATKPAGATAGAWKSAPKAPVAAGTGDSLQLDRLSRAIARLECEEAAADTN